MKFRTKMPFLFLIYYNSLLFASLSSVSAHAILCQSGQKQGFNLQVLRDIPTTRVSFSCDTWSEGKQRDGKLPGSNIQKLSDGSLLFQVSFSSMKLDAIGQVCSAAVKNVELSCILRLYLLYFPRQTKVNYALFTRFNFRATRLLHKLF